MWRALYDTKGKPARAVTSREELAELLRGETGVLWVDLCAPAPEERTILSDVFAFDSFLLEDVFAQSHHPKADDFGDHVYLVAHGLAPGSRPGEIRTEELDVILSKRYLVTHRLVPMTAVERAWERCLRAEPAAVRGPDQSLQQVLSFEAARFVTEAERLENELLDLEDLLFEAPARGLSRRLFEIKSDIARIRRTVGAQREVVHKLARGEFAAIPQKALVYFRDVYDDFYRAGEMLDLVRELSTAALESYLTMTANRTNEVMKALTTVATFILPLTLITGWYGMNFEHMPALRWPLGELYVLGLFGAVCAVLFLILRRRGWV